MSRQRRNRERRAGKGERAGRRIHTPPPAGAEACEPMTRVLLIEDDPETATEILTELGGKGYAVAHAVTGTAGLLRARGEAWDLLIVDRMLPGQDGLSVVRQLRQENVQTPALFLSALGGIDDKVLGLRAGGDDYLVKPFALAELSARLEALLRRPVQPQRITLRLGPLELDRVRREAWRGGRKLDLLPREFQLLDYMAQHEGQVVTRAMLLEDVWNYRFTPQTNLVDVHMGRLRRKLDTPDEPPLICSIRGAGFCLRAPA
jgi:two-component system OmpR family response regulator